MNQLGQPIGEAVDGWTAPSAPRPHVMIGRYCRLEPLDIDQHTEQLWRAFSRDVEGRNWTYLFHGPYATIDGFRDWVRSAASSADPMFFTVVELAREAAVGVAAYLRIAPAAGSIEVGHINFSPLLQRTPAATEAMYLMMKHAFDLGYRRYEWKCDALNAASRAAAVRLGLTFEGVFRQALVYKDRNRDTAWYAAIDKEWPVLGAAFEQWLAPENFDREGRQRHPLAALRARLMQQDQR